MTIPFWTNPGASAQEAQQHLAAFSRQIGPLLKAIPLPSGFFEGVTDDEELAAMTVRAVRALEADAAYVGLQTEVANNVTIALHFGRLLWLRGGTT